MSGPQRRHVAIEPDPAGYLVALRPTGPSQPCRSFIYATRLAFAWAAEHSCQVNNASGWSPIKGDAGPQHLIGSPWVFCVREPDASWLVLVWNCPRRDSHLERMTYLGEQAEASAKRRADQLFAHFRQRALDEQARLERIKELTRKERAAARSEVRQ